MTALYTVIDRLTVSSDGVKWMGLTHENLLYACTSRQVTMWNLNHFVHFFGLSRSRVSHLGLQSGVKKSTRLLTVGEDSWYGSTQLPEIEGRARERERERGGWKMGESGERREERGERGEAIN